MQPFRSASATLLWSFLATVSQCLLSPSPTTGTGVSHQFPLQQLLCHYYPRMINLHCPTTNGGMQTGSSVGIYARCIHVFACLAPISMLSWCLLTKFLHWSSVGSLSTEHCWLGVSPQKSLLTFASLSSIPSCSSFLTERLSSPRLPPPPPPLLPGNANGSHASSFFCPPVRSLFSKKSL